MKVQRNMGVMFTAGQQQHFWPMVLLDRAKTSSYIGCQW